MASKGNRKCFWNYDQSRWRDPQWYICLECFWSLMLSLDLCRCSNGLSQKHYCRSNIWWGYRWCWHYWYFLCNKWIFLRRFGSKTQFPTIIIRDCIMSSSIIFRSTYTRGLSFQFVKLSRWRLKMISQEISLALSYDESQLPCLILPAPCISFNPLSWNRTYSRFSSVLFLDASCR